MKNLISAIQFITVLPVGKRVEYNPVGMVPFFPVVGLIIGTMLCLFDRVVIHLWPGQVAAVLDVLFLIAVTGAFHLDGLGDSADGIFSHRPREKALSIMKDSRVGAMGLVAVICGLAVKWGALASLTPNGFQRALILMIIPAYSRASMLFGIRFLEYGRPEGGTAGDIFNKKLEIRAFVWFAVPVALSLLLGLRGLWINICFLSIVTGIVSYYRKKMGCITGDMLGAMTEVTESLLFLLAVANI